MTSNEKKKFLDLIQKYFEGGKVDKKSSDPVYRKGEFKNQDLSDEGLKKYFGEKAPNFNDGGQAEESQQKQYQAKDYFGKGANGPGEGVANSMGIAMTMADGGWTDLANKIREAFKDPPLSKQEIQNKETQEERNERIRRENSQRNTGKRPSLESEDPEYIDPQTQYKFDGGSIPSTSANTASSLAPLLKATYAGPSKKKKVEKMATGGWAPEQVPKAPHPLHMPGFHSPTEKKYPINIPRAPRLTMPKRLRPLDIVKGYSDGTGPDGVQPDNSQDFMNYQQLSPDDFTQPGQSIPSNAGLTDFIKYNLAHRDPTQTAQEMAIAASTGGLGSLERKLPSRALTQEEMEAMEDLFKADPTMKTQALQEQADLYGKQGDIPADIRNQIPQSNFPAKISETPNISQEKGLIASPEISETPSEKGLVVRGERGLIKREPSTESPISSEERPVEEIPEDNIPKMGKLTKAGILGAAALAADEMTGDESKDQQIVKDIQRKVASESPTQQKDLIKKIKTSSKEPTLPRTDSESDKAIEEAYNEQSKEDSEGPYPGEEEVALKAADQIPKETMEEDKPSKTQSLLDMLKDAQEKRNNVDLMSGLGAIAERGAAAYAGIPTTQQESYKENMAIAQQSVDDVKEQIAMEGKDPQSQTSQMARTYLQNLTGQQVDPNTTADSIKEFFPMIKAKVDDDRSRQELGQKLKERKEDVKYKYDSLSAMKQLALTQQIQKDKQHAEDKADLRESTKQDKQEANDLQRVDKFNKYISEGLATSRSPMGTAVKNRQAVENIRALLDGTKDFNDLDNRQIVEVARVLDRVLSGGQSTISGSEHLTPESARQWLAKKWEFITSQRQGAGAGSFVKTMSDTLDREGQMADKQIKKFQNELFGPYKSILTNDKNSRSYQNLVDTLKANHLDVLLPKDERTESSNTTSQSNKTLVKKGYNSKTNQTQLIYSDGTSEIKDGKL